MIGCLFGIKSMILLLLKECCDSNTQDNNTQEGYIAANTQEGDITANSIVDNRPKRITQRPKYLREFV